MPQGRKGHIGLAKEVTAGIPVAASDYFRFHNESLVTAIEEVVPGNITGVFDEGQTYQGLRTHAGDIEMDAHPNILGFLLQGAIGDLTSTIQDDPAVRAWQVDATPGPDVFVEQTVAFNDVTVNDVIPFPATEAVGDYFAVGAAARFDRLRISTGTVGTVGVVAWEYWNGTAWAALVGVVDGTAGFTVSGFQVITFTRPADWARRTLSTTDNLFYIRARVTTVYTINPLLTQGFVNVRIRHDATIRQTEFSALSVLRPYTIEVHRDLGQAFQYAGCNVNELELTWGIASKVMMARVGLIPFKMVRIAATTPVFEDTTPFLWNQCVVSLPDPTAFNTMTDLRVLVNNNVEGKSYIDTTREYARVRPAGVRQVTVSGTMLASSAEFDSFDTRAQRFMKLLLTGDALGAGNYRLQLDIPLYQYRAYPVGISGPDEIMVAFDGKGTFDPNVANTPIDTILDSNKTAY
jgi:hypothetical protein